MSDLFSFERFDWFWRIAIAQGLILFLFLMSMTSFSLPMTGVIRPYFIVMAIYYWAIYRPTLLSPFFIFLIGLLFDLLIGFPVGIHAILFLVAQWIIRDQRIFLMGQPYIMVWLGFLLTCFSIYALEWGVFSALAGDFLSLMPLLWSFVASVFLFPLVTLLFIAAHRLLPVAPNVVH